MINLGDKIERQLAYFRSGFPFLNIISAATPDRGIRVLEKGQEESMISVFESFEGSVLKFVPASGAATRMFKDLYSYLNTGIHNDQSKEFVDKIEQFAFYQDLKSRLKEGYSQQDLVEAVLTDRGLNYGALPKGLIKFHKYPHGSRTSFEEHLFEAAHYAVDKHGYARVSVTVSQEHMEMFKELASSVKGQFEKEFNCTYEIEFSTQKRETDTIAVDMDNNPFVKSDGEILFRPGGHGALIDNLNDCTADIIFIKNIDNVSKGESAIESCRWKKILGGVLIEARRELFNYISRIEREEFTDELYNEIVVFLKDRFCIEVPNIPHELRRVFLKSKLDRPIRVCGMVRNTGEPGGGPYIIKDADGSTSLQILEAAQIDMTNESYKKMVKGSTHFNPVDIVCSTVDHHGEPFNLSRFVDPETGFISEKSYEGRALKAQELPGLWNGAMSQWNTIFVEVPLVTFNPVKTVIDLLRPEHL